MKRKNKRKYKGGDEEEVIKDKIGKVNHKKKRGKRWKNAKENFLNFQNCYIERLYHERINETFKKIFNWPV